MSRSWKLFVHERHLWSGENDGESGHPHPAHDDGTVMDGAPLVFWVMIGPPATLFDALGDLTRCRAEATTPIIPVVSSSRAEGSGVGFIGER